MALGRVSRYLQTFGIGLPVNRRKDARSARLGGERTSKLKEVRGVFLSTHHTCTRTAGDL